MPRPFHNSGLIARKPKKYAGLVEQAEHVHVADALAGLSPEERRTREVYVPQPNVILRRETRGVIRPWWVLLCARCGRRCEYVVKPPWATDPNDWRCRRCHNLTYASHRHGKSEASPARRLHRPNPTRKQRLRIEKAGRQAARVAACETKVRRRDAEQAAAYLRPVVADMAQAAQRGQPFVIVSDQATGPRVVSHDELVEDVTQAMIAENARQRLRDELAADAEENAAVLASYSPRSRSLRAKAARLLDRLGRLHGL